MADLDKQARPDSTSREMRTLEAGTASFADVALVPFGSRPPLNFGTAVTIRWVPAILSLLAVVPACIVLVTPDRGVQSVMLNIGIFAILHGVALIVSDARAAAARARIEAPVT